MDPVAKILTQLYEAGYQVSTRDGKLNVFGPVEQMPKRLREQVAANRDLLVALVADSMPPREVLLNTCTRAVNGLGVDPGELADWLLQQGDPGWCAPRAARRWAELIHEHGFPV